MKRLMFLFMLIVFSITLPVMVHAKTIVTDGLVSYWTFDLHNIKNGIAEDAWGENNATIVGNPEIIGGRVKQALEFDGIKDYVNLTTLGDFGAKLGSSTFEAWIKTNYKETWTTIFKTLSDGCGNSGIMIWGIDINRTPNKLRVFLNLRLFFERMSFYFIYHLFSKIKMGVHFPCSRAIFQFRMANGITLYIRLLRM